MASFLKRAIAEYRDEVARLKAEDEEAGSPTERRYREIYDYYLGREADGRRMRWYAPIYGFMAAFVVFSAEALLPTSVVLRVEPSLLLLVPPVLIGAWVWNSVYRRAVEIMVQAQRTLVAIDTEQNTREAVELLERLVARQPTHSMSAE